MAVRYSCSTVSCCAALLVILVISFHDLASPCMAVEEFKVGDDRGWQQPSINQTDLYHAWASRRRFHVGDLLRFVYQNDSVVEVDKWGYYHCKVSGPETVYNDGNNTLITLDKPGTMYFVSGYRQHCKEGQRLLIQVLPLHPTHGSSSPPPESVWGVLPGPSPSPLSNSGGSTVISSFRGGVVMVLLTLWMLH